MAKSESYGPRNRMHPADNKDCDSTLSPPDDSAALTHEDIAPLHILRRVCPESVVGMLERCPIRILEPGETLLEAGQTNQTMFMILSGKLSVHLETRESEPVAMIETGQTVGEISVIDDSPASAHVVAAVRTILLAVNEETFWRLVGASHEFASNLLLLLSERMRQSNNTLSENVRLRRQFERDALIDGLTGLHNRRWLNDKLPRLIDRHHRNTDPLSVIMLDIDHFKRFNDDYGHDAGDHVLGSVSRTLMSKLRPTDLAARYGGEEFVIILANTDLEGARTAAERLRGAVGVKKMAIRDGRTLPPITISLGISLLQDQENMDSLLKRADNALYRAKGNGRNRVEWDDPGDRP